MEGPSQRLSYIWLNLTRLYKRDLGPFRAVFPPWYYHPRTVKTPVSRPRRPAVWQHIAQQMLQEFWDSNKGDYIDVTFEVLEDDE